MIYIKPLIYLLYWVNHVFALFNLNVKIPNLKRRAVDKPILRIQDGEDDTNNEFPYVVPLGFEISQKMFESVNEKIRHLIYKEFIQSCSASVIADQWALTAAHCKRKKTTKLRYGNMDVPPNDTLATYSKTLKMIRHPAYRENDKFLYNDISLLRIEKVRLDVFGRVLMADYKTLVGLPVKFAGFGVTHRDHMMSKQVKNTRSRQIGQGMVMTCVKRTRRVIPSLCLVTKCSTRLQAALSGDSGGPILQGGRIVGVFSTFVMHRGYVFNTLTPVSPYLDWMWLVMRTNS